VLLVWLAFGVALLIYSNDWHPSGWTELRQEATAPKPPVSVTDQDTGSIMIVPTRGEDCRQMMLDNRTGRMWDNGVVNCLRGGIPSGKRSARRNELIAHQRERQGI
jgi:hypothetical protein